MARETSVKDSRRIPTMKLRTSGKYRKMLREERAWNTQMLSYSDLLLESRAKCCRIRGLLDRTRKMLFRIRIRIYLIHVLY